MKKIASPQELQSELRRLLALTEDAHPSRLAMARELRGLATRLAADDDEKKGEWNLTLMKDGSKWKYHLRNPQGGGQGSKGNASGMDAAIRHALENAKGSLSADDKVWVIVQEWDADAEDYKTTKKFWADSKGKKTASEYDFDRTAEALVIAAVNRPAPVKWTERGGKWLARAQFADGKKHEWQIAEDGDKFTVSVKTDEGTFKKKTPFDSLEQAQKYAGKFVEKANGDELLDKAMKDFSKS